MNTLYRTASATLFVLFLAALAATFYQTTQLRDARSRAERLEALRLSASHQARQFAQDAADARESTRQQVEAANARRLEAESRVRNLEANAASLRTAAVQTAQMMADAIEALDSPNPTDTQPDLKGLLNAHLEADAEVVESYEQRLEAKDEIIAALEEKSDAFEMRAVTAELALGASQLECSLCREEAAAWKDAATPGWFNRLRQRLPSMGLTAVATAVLILAL